MRQVSSATFLVASVLALWGSAFGAPANMTIRDDVSLKTGYHKNYSPPNPPPSVQRRHRLVPI